MTTTTETPATETPATETPATAETGKRAETAALLRMVADLIDHDTATTLPRVDVTYHATSRQDSAEAVTALAEALPCEWTATLHRSGSTEWLSLNSDGDGTCSLSGAKVTILANVSAACTEAGERTVTDWRPRPGVAALLGGRPVRDKR